MVSITTPTIISSEVPPKNIAKLGSTPASFANVGSIAMNASASAPGSVNNESILSSRFAVGARGFYSGDETAVALKVVSHVVGLNRNSRIKVSESDNQRSQYYVVPQAEHIVERHLYRFAEHPAYKAGKEHHCLGEDYRHHVCSVHLHRYVLTFAHTNLATALARRCDCLGVLYGYLADTSHQEQSEHYHSQPYHYFKQEHYHSSAHLRP